MMTIAFRCTPLLLAFFLQAAPKVEPGFTSLFNGKDFTGWKLSNEASWSIENGAMKANGTPGHAFYDGEFRNHMFRNFELKVDVMTKANSNGGIYVLTEYQEKGFPRKGFEIQVNNSYVKDRVKTGSLYHVQDVLDDSPAKDDVWFTEHIIVKDNTITVMVDGKQTVSWTQPADWTGGREGAGRSISGPGTIAFQAHDPNSTVYYRNVRIKPLDANP
jgi:Domain of Unknown Function (DUF1080)